jgi:ribA/ribD-fused uncharacterized protein
MEEAAITEFRGDYFFLSNFYLAEVELNGMKFRSLEHAFQAAKTLDYVERDEIRRRQTPRAAKQMGQGLKLRRDWQSVKVKIMEHLVRDKFTRTEDLKAKLLATGDRLLVEGNTWGDAFWGMVKREGGMVGNNHLGEILMKVRKELNEKRNILV